MNREQFISGLRKQLHSIPRKDLDDIISDYEEHFRTAAEKGRTEEEAAKALGPVRTVAAAIRAEYFVSTAGESRTPADIISAVFAAAALGFFNVIFVLGPFCAVFSVAAAFWIISLAFTLSGFISAAVYLAVSIFSIDAMLSAFLPGLSFVTVLFGLLTLGMTGIFLGIASFYATKVLLKLTLSYIQWNVNLVLKRRN